MAELKTRENTASVKEFIAAVADDRMRADCNKLMRLMRKATGKPPRMWGSSIVGFDSLHYVYDSGREGDWPAVGFSPRKRNLTLYIMPGFSQYATLLSRLGKHKTGKSCLYINRLDDVDVDVLTQLVDQSVAAIRTKYAPTSNAGSKKVAGKKKASAKKKTSAKKTAARKTTSARKKTSAKKTAVKKKTSAKKSASRKRTQGW